MSAKIARHLQVINGVAHDVAWVRYNDASDAEYNRSHTRCLFSLTNASLTAILSERISTIDQVDIFFTGAFDPGSE